MKKINILLLAAISAISISCSKDVLEATDSTNENVNTENVNTENLVPVTLLIGESENTTRTVIVPNSEGALSISWKENELISLVPIGGTTVYNVKYAGRENGKAKFIGVAAENQKYVAICPALDPAKKVGEGYDFLGYVSSKQNLIQLYTNTINNFTLTQKGNNNVSHLAAYDFEISDIEFKVSSLNNMIGLNNNILLEHVFAYAKVILSASQIDNNKIVNVELKGFWKNQYNANDNKRYRVQVEDITAGQDVTAWFFIPAGSATAGTDIEVHVSNGLKSKIYKRKLPSNFTIPSGIGLGEKKAKVIELDYRTINVDEETGFYFSWGNLDGYDARVTDHMFWDTNAMSDQKSEAELKNLISSNYNSTTGWSGLVNKTPVQDQYKLLVNAWNNNTYVGAPNGMGDPATYYVGSDYHTPTHDEWNKLLDLQGTKGPDNQDQEPGKHRTQYTLKAVDTPFATFVKDDNGLYVWDSVNKRFVEDKTSQGVQRYKLNPNGHLTAFWVAVNKDASKNDAYGVDIDLGGNKADFNSIKEWRIYPCGATSLNDPYIVIPFMGYHSSSSYIANSHRFWCATPVDYNKTSWACVIEFNYDEPICTHLNAQTKRGNACMIIPLLRTTAEDWANLNKSSGWKKPITY